MTIVSNLKMFTKSGSKKTNSIKEQNTLIITGKIYLTLEQYIYSVTHGNGTPEFEIKTV